MSEWPRNDASRRGPQMILRRLADAVRNQSWFTVFIEFGLVVAGVFLGLQVNNWNESRLDRQQESILLERLASDFRDIEARASRSALATEERIANLEALSIALSDSSEKPDLDSMLELFSESAGVNLSTAASETYEEMLATGRLSLIRSQALRNALANYNRIKERSDAARQINWEITVSIAPEFLRAGSLVRGVISGKGAKQDFERELSKILAGQDIIRDIAAFLDIQKFILAWENRGLEAAQIVLVELGEAGSSHSADSAQAN